MSYLCNTKIINMISRNIKTKLTEYPSYLKWSVERLCAKFNCTRKVMNQIVTELYPVKQEYINSLNKPKARTSKTTPNRTRATA